MPKLIDADARSAEIAAASMRVLERHGLAALSVRGVAEEAGIAAASLRRAFPTQHALRVHCLDLIQERATQRIMALPRDGGGRPLALDVLAQLLPLDADRRTELAAQVQLGVLALTDDRLRPTSVRLNRAVLDACRIVIGILAESEQLAPDRNPDSEAHRLHALLDGLAMHGLWDGGTDAGRRALDILDQHLGELGAPPA